ncbi:MAG: FAD-dependent oxidoreductase, partial [Thermoanaerobaculia bacterium]
MLLDSHELEPGQVLEGDVCIVGAGAAGITLARELASARRRVVLLEGGGTTYGQA